MTSFSRLFLTGRSPRAGHETTMGHWLTHTINPTHTSLWYLLALTVWGVLGPKVALWTHFWLCWNITQFVHGTIIYPSLGGSGIHQFMGPYLMPVRKVLDNFCHIKHIYNVGQVGLKGHIHSFCTLLCTNRVADSLLLLSISFAPLEV